MATKSPFTEAEEKRIIDAVVQAETNTSGEIRVHVEPKCKGDDAYARAVKVFEKLGMTKTKLRNGVLVYVATEDHQFAIIGDVGIDQKVAGDFWDTTKNLMLEHFKKGNLVDGIMEGVLDAGEQLKHFFPYQSDDVNELSNDISYGKHD